MEQRAVIKFNAKLGKSAAETFRLTQVYGDACLSRSNKFTTSQKNAKSAFKNQDNAHHILR